jgi:hypothetical protein
MIPDVSLLTLAFSLLVVMARFAKLAKAFMMQLLGKNLIGSLRNGHVNNRPPQALPSSQ